MSEPMDNGAERIRQLIERSINETVTVAEVGELESLIAADGESRLFYLRYMLVHLGLGWEQGALSDLSAPYLDTLASGVGARGRVEGEQRKQASAASVFTKAAAAQGGWSLGAKWWGVIAAAAMVAVGAAVAIAVVGGVLSGDGDDEAAVAPGRPVAVLLDASGVIWNSEPRQAGEVLVTQTVSIAEGSLEIEFRSGAVLMAHGPVSFELNGRNLATLRSGRVHVQAPQGAGGFTVDAPRLRVVDLGTEFVVWADAGGSGVSVIDGVVDAHPVSEAGVVGSSSRRLTAGRAAVASSTGGALTEIDSNRIGVAMRRPSESAALERYIAAVEADEPIAYWPLEATESRAASDDLSGGGRTLHGVGDTSSELSTRAGPAGTAFDGSLIVDPGGQVTGLDLRDNWAVEGWLWIGGIEEAANVVLIEPGTQSSGWQLLAEPAGDAAGGDCVPVLKLFGVGRVRFADAALRRERWVHLAIVRDSADGVIRCYRDGVEVQRVESARGGVASPGSYLKIGGRAAGERWIGRMAHLAVYDRPLDAAAIRTHYTAGRPRFDADDGDATGR